MRIFTIILLFFNFLACSPRYTQFIGQYQAEGLDSRPDYSNLQYWAAHPDKKDCSDSLPEPLKKDYRPDSRVDVFFIHPTTLTSRVDTRWNAELNDPQINAKTDYNSILYQASVFNEYRVFAPRYRQAHIRSYFSSDTVSAGQAFDIAYEDIKNAFQYYLDHFNHGHAIIIASHSQGSTHATRLLKEFFDKSPLREKLVAAYLVGMYVPDTLYTELKVCQDSLATGCICSWRTFRTGYEPQFVTREKGSALVVNPLTWNTGPEKALPQLNLGGILRDFNTVHGSVAGAQIHDGIIWTRRPKFKGSIFLRRKNYHIGDINLYYMNLRYNLRQRVRSYFESAH